MGLKKATLTTRLLAWLDWKEEWREYYCSTGKVYWLAPERFWDLAEDDGCPHCGENLIRSSERPHY